MSLATQLGALITAIGAEILNRTPVMMPPSGWYMEPQGVLSAGGGSPVKGVVHFIPFMVGPRSWITSGCVFDITTAFAGGAGASVTVGLYGTNADNMPDVTSGPLVQGSFALNGAVTTGIKSITWTGGNYTMKPGLYWIGILYTWATTGPSAGALNMYTNVTFRVPTPTSIAPGTSIRGLISAASTFTALPTTTPTYSVSGATDNLAVGIVRA